MKVVITIEIPDAAASVSVNTTDQEDDDRSLVEIYWSDYLSDNGRELYAAAATIERAQGLGYTLNTIADQMGREYSSAQSIHRTTGRAGGRWFRDTGTEAPIRLIGTAYEWNDEQAGNRTTYQLPDGVAEEIAGF